MAPIIVGFLKARRYILTMSEANYNDRQNDIRDWKTPKIDTFENIYPDRDYEITMSITEFTCVCPRTGLPDFGELRLTYYPDKECLELKSFKEYILAYRDKGIFHENVVNRVLDDVVAACKPRRAKLEGIFNIRGGIQTTVVREWGK